MSLTGLPFDDIRALLAALPPASETCADDLRARARDQLSAGGLGRVQEIAEHMAAWQGRSRPTADRPLVAIFAASHGVAAHDVSAWPRESARAMMEAYAAGGGAVNQICVTYGLGLKVFELALDVPTGDATRGPAFDEAGCAATIAFGMEAIAGGTDLLCLGHVAVGAETIAAAICCALYGGAPADWLPESGIDVRARRIAAAEQALDLHRGHFADPLEVLRRLGGRDVAAMAGAIVSARMERIPVLLDGFVSCAAAAVLNAAAPGAVDHCLAAHGAPGPHAHLLEKLGKRAVLDLGVSLGEGAGAALAAGVVRAAVACCNETATFEQAKVPRPLGA